MNATRAATIRLRPAFDGAVSLGRVQAPTLALIAAREEEIRAFVPEPYWLVDAAFEADGERRYDGRFHSSTGPAGKLRGPRIESEQQAQQIVAACAGDAAAGEDIAPGHRPGATITKLEKKEPHERAP